MPSESDPSDRWVWSTLDRFLSYLVSDAESVVSFSYIEYVLRIRLVKISLIFIKYEVSTEPSKGLVHVFFLLTHTLKNHDFPEIRKTLLEPQKHPETHTWTSGKNTGPSLAKLSSDS